MTQTKYCAFAQFIICDNLRSEIFSVSAGIIYFKEIDDIKTWQIYVFFLISKGYFWKTNGLGCQFYMIALADIESHAVLFDGVMCVGRNFEEISAVWEKKIKSRWE